VIAGHDPGAGDALEAADPSDYASLSRGEIERALARLTDDGWALVRVTQPATTDAQEADDAR
jgi:hypothetical protein